MFRIFGLIFVLVAVQAQAQSNSGPAVGTRYTKAVHGDWTVQCVKAEEGQADNCSMLQRLFRTQGQAIAEIQFYALAPGQQAVAGANVRVPLETMLQRGLVLQVGDAEPLRFPFHHCSTEGCLSRIGFEAPQLFQLEQAEQAIMTIYSVRQPDEPVNIPLSLVGFIDAYDELLQ